MRWGSLLSLRARLKAIFLARAGHFFGRTEDPADVDLAGVLHHLQGVHENDEPADNLEHLADRTGSALAKKTDTFTLPFRMTEAKGSPQDV